MRLQEQGCAGDVIVIIVLLLLLLLLMLPVCGYDDDANITHRPSCSRRWAKS